MSYQGEITLTKNLCSELEVAIKIAKCNNKSVFTWRGFELFIDYAEHLIRGYSKYENTIKQIRVVG